MSFPRFAETSLESSSPSAPGLSRSEGGIVVVVDVAGGGVKWIELPSVLYVLIMAHLSIADLVHIDQTCRHLQTAARLATPACSTLCMEIPDYGGPRPLTPIPDEAILRFLPRHLKLRTDGNYASGRCIALAKAVCKGAVADASRGVRRLHVLETSGLCWCDLKKLVPLLPAVAVLRITRAFVPFHDCVESFCRGLALTLGLATLEVATDATAATISGFYRKRPGDAVCLVQPNAPSSVNTKPDTVAVDTKPTKVAGGTVCHAGATVRRLHFRDWRVTQLPERIWTIWEANLRVLSVADVENNWHTSFQLLLLRIPLTALEIRNGGVVATRALTLVDDERNGNMTAGTASTLVTLSVCLKKLNSATVAAIKRFKALRSVCIGGTCNSTLDFTGLGTLCALEHLDMSRVKTVVGIKRQNPHPVAPEVETDMSADVATKGSVTSNPRPNWEAAVLRVLPEHCTYVCPVPLLDKTLNYRKDDDDDHDDDERSFLGEAV
jgi:hypothetical protein